MSDRASSFNCTQCGAGLDALGGGRVRIHVCPYCGAELDAQDDYRVLAQFRDLKRPTTPFRPGMTGELWGVEFTVIGTMAWLESHAGKSWRWVDHQIYSPTHGYTWLTVENGYVTFARKVRDKPMPATLSENVIESAESRPSIRYNGESFSYYGSGWAKPTFIEGEFNYRPDMSESIRYVSLVKGDRMLDVIETANEREYEVSVLPNQAALAESFGISGLLHPQGVHPLDVIERTDLQLFVRNMSLAAAAVACVIGVFSMASGERLASSEQVSVRTGLTLPFEVTESNRLSQIDIWADANNSWAWFEAELTDVEDEPVAEFERGVEYYRGSDWREGSQTARTRLHLPPGQYTLEVRMAEAEVDWTGGKKASRMQVTVWQGVSNTFWLWVAAAFFLLIGGGFLVQRMYHNMRRMSGSDWSDE